MSLSQRGILFFWLPLAASWALMSCEGPILQAVIARLGDVQTQLAAFGVVVSLEITIESPVIMLLATSTALATNARNYRVLRSFVLQVNALVTIVAVLIAFTPLFDLIVRRLMGIPAPIADAAQPGMMIMTLWSAAIGFRRFLQGILIRQGQTRWIGYGTVTRLLAASGTGIVLAVVSSLPGIVIASTALMAGVVMEALFVALVARQAVGELLKKPAPDAHDSVTMMEVIRFHAPLAATSLLTLLAQPLIGAGLARMPSAAETLAAWPVIWGILFVFRSPAFALPEVVIALLGDPANKEPVRGFCWSVGVGSTLAMLLLVATPALVAYLRYIAGLPERLIPFAVNGLILSVLLPSINALHSWYRGLLMFRRRTPVIYWGMGINLAVTAIIVATGALLRAAGVATAAVSLVAALVIEVYYLRARLVN